MTFLKLVGKKDAQKGSFKTEIQAKQWSATLRWEMLFWHRFQLIMTLGLRATNPVKSFAVGTVAGQIGLWFCVGALAVKSGRAGLSREWAGPGRTGWCLTLWPPPCIWQTLHWIISPPETLPSPMCSEGSVRAQRSSFCSSPLAPLCTCAAASRRMLHTDLLPV